MDKTKERRANSTMSFTSHAFGKFSPEECLRNVGMDYVKAFGIFSICVGHFAPVSSWLRVIIYSYNIPLFVFVSGYLKKQSTGFCDFLLKAFKRIMVPYLLWFIISNMPAVLTGQLSIKGFVVNLIFLHGQTSWNSSLWFLPCIFVVYVVFECLLRLTGERKLLLLAFGGLFLGIAFVCNLKGITTCIFGLNKIALMVFFYICGFLLRGKFVPPKTILQTIVSVILLVAMCGIAWMCNYQDNISMLYCDYNNMVFYVLNAVVMVVLIAYTCGAFPYCEGIRLISDNTLFIMSSHLFVRLAISHTKIVSDSVPFALITGAFLIVSYYIFLLLAHRTFSDRQKIKGVLRYIGIQI